MMEKRLEEIKEIKTITAMNLSVCTECKKHYLPDNTDDAVNHYLKIHDFKLLHISTQSSLHHNGDLVHDIAFIIGK